MKNLLILSAVALSLAACSAYDNYSEDSYNAFWGIADNETSVSSAEEITSSNANASSGSETPASSDGKESSDSSGDKPASSGSESLSSAGETPASSGSETPASSAGEAPASSGSETPASSAGEAPASSGSETPASSAGEAPASSGSETPASSASESVSSSSEVPASSAGETPVSSSSVAESSSSYFFCGEDVVVDAKDGNKEYGTTKVGSLCFITENLSRNVGDSRCYDDSEANCETFGRLYRYSDAITACPQGTHLPSKEEWTSAVESGTNGFTAGGKSLKAKTSWTKNNGDGSTNFAALASGIAYYDEDDEALVYVGKGEQTVFWTSTQTGTRSWYFALSSNNNNVASQYDEEGSYYSVRCVVDKFE